MTTDPTPHTERAAAAAAELHDQYSLNWIKELAPMKTERPDLYEFYEKRFLGAEKERERMAAIIAKHFNDDALRLAAGRALEALKFNSTCLQCGASKSGKTIALKKATEAITALSAALAGEQMGRNNLP